MKVRELMTEAKARLTGKPKPRKGKIKRFCIYSSIDHRTGKIESPDISKLPLSIQEQLEVAQKRHSTPIH